MLANLSRRRYLVLWQILFLIIGTSWLWAPHLNTGLSYRVSLISQYEVPFQPFAWLFRFADFIGGVLLCLMAYHFIKTAGKKTAGWLLLIIGIGLVCDPLFSTTCHQIANTCSEFVSFKFVLHAIETVITSSVIVVIGVYDAILRRKLVSVAFVFFQIAYGLLFLSQYSSHSHFSTLSQYIYQTIVIVWLAWFSRDYLINKNFKTHTNEESFVTFVVAVWAFINGILAILVSLAHIHLLGRIKGLYFAGDSAWLAQHGVIIGIVMLYLSRHLARGELRARQIFLIIAGVETLKYSVITPHPGLMVLYLLTFVGLFVLRDDFVRGQIPLTWELRVRDLYFMISALLFSALIALISLDRDNRVALITGRSFDNFFDYVNGETTRHMSSALLAHTITAFLVASIASILWILFKPYKKQEGLGRRYDHVEELLQKHSNSTEDFFKLWPKDKDYFWQADGKGFVAYKLVGSTAFALADPMSGNKGESIKEFINWARERRIKACFLPVFDQSLPSYNQAELESVQIGSSAVINIENFINTTAKDKWWRWQKNRAVKNGYQYGQSSPPHSVDFLQQLQTVSKAWLTIEGHEERGFALGYFDGAYLDKCIIHYLHEETGKIIAFTNQLPEFNETHTATVDLLRYLPETNNTMPYLLCKTIETISQESKYQFFDLGFVPFAKTKGVLVNIARALSGSRFSAKGLEQFKNKFDPTWSPNYIAYDGDLTDLAVIALNLEKAMQIDS